MATKKYKAKKLERGKYLYRGFIIECVGYIDSQHHNAWQAHDDICDYCAQSGTLKEAKIWIDDEIDNNHK